MKQSVQHGDAEPGNRGLVTNYLSTSDRLSTEL